MKKMLKKMLAVLLSITMLIPMSLSPSMTANAMSDREVDKDLICAGIACIPYAGYPLNTMFSSSIANWLGLTSLDDIADQLDEISNQINALSVQIEANQRQLLETMYANSLNQYYDLITDIKANTRGYYNDLSAVENEFNPKSGDVRDRMLETLYIADLSGTELNDYIQDLNKASLYMSGGAVGMSENLLNLVYKAYCKDAAFGGEAAYYAAKTNGDIANCIQNAYFIASAMAYAQYYISENYSAYKELQSTDPEFEDFDITPYKSTIKTRSRLNTINQNYGEIFGGLVKQEDTKTNTTIYHCKPVEKGTPFTEGYVGNYNNMVKTNKYYFIKGTDYSKAPVIVDYIKLSSTIDCYPMSKAFNIKQNNFDKFTSYGYKLREISDTRKNLLSNEQLNYIFTHIQNNPAFGTDGKEEVTLMQALKNFGFNFGGYEAYALANNISDKDLQIMAVDSATLVAALRVYGPAMNENVNSADDNLNKNYPQFMNSKDGIRNEKYEDCIPFFFKAQDEDKVIDNEEEFVELLNNAYNVESTGEYDTYELNANLDLTGYDLPTFKNSSKKFFQGTFDGKGHTIKNANINGLEYGGLFSVTGRNTCIKDLNIENIKVNANAGGAVIGATASTKRYGTVIDNVNVISGTINSNLSAGGLVGEVSDAIIVKNCTNNINIKAPGIAGGIAGATNGNALFENNTNNGNITSTGSDAGGIVGRNNEGSIDFANSTNNGKIRAELAEAHAGQICGFDRNRNKPINEDTTNASFWATVFGEGNIIIILAMAGLIISSAAVVIIVQNKKKKNTIS